MATDARSGSKNDTSAPAATSSIWPFGASTICCRRTSPTGVAEMSEHSDKSRADWVCTESLSKERGDVKIGAKTNDEGEVTLVDLEASNYMNQTERWMTVDDCWMLDLEDCR